MSELFLRKVVVSIVPQSGSSIEIDKLRVKFDIEKTNESTPNNAEIEIYNLSETTRSALEAKGTKVQVSIGYLGLNPDGFLGSGIGGSSSVASIFIGDVMKSLQEIDKTDIITKVELADGGNRYRNSRLEKGYPPNAALDNILTDVVDAMGLSKGAKQDIPSKKYANGITLSGLAREHLDNLCRANNLEWSIQDESVQIIPKNSSLENTLIVIAPDSGLIGSPNKTKNGVEFRALIQPDLVPGKKVQLNSRFIKGSYKLRKVTFEGDSQQGDFLAKCEATEQ